MHNPMLSTLISAPHAHDHSSVHRVMIHVCLALVPCTLFGLYRYGLPAINLFIITIVSALLWESLCLKLLGQSQARLADYSALLTGWLLALSLPPWAPWWIGVGGAFVAIVLGKQLYGGLGQNIFNPAMLARVALLISFPVQMTTWPTTEAHWGYGWPALGLLDSLSITVDAGNIADGMTGATYLGTLKSELSTGASASDIISQHFSLTAAISGTAAGSLGEGCTVLILLGGLWLWFMRIISWHIPLSMLATTALLAFIFNWLDPNHYGGVGFHLFSGGLMLGAIFIATDLVTSPSSRSGQLVFGAGCGALTFVIRSWGNFPEGVGFAVLFMNALTPLIDMYFRPRVYGRTLRGLPVKGLQATDKLAQEKLTAEKKG